MLAKAASSVAVAGVATLLAASSTIPILDNLKPFWAALVLVLVLAGLMHAAAGAFVPRPAWAMAAPGPVLFGWLTWALWGDITAEQHPGVEAMGGPGLLVAVGLGAVILGLAMAGFVAMGAAWRRARRPQAQPAEPAAPPYP